MYSKGGQSPENRFGQDHEVIHQDSTFLPTWYFPTSSVFNLTSRFRVIPLTKAHSGSNNNTGHEKRRILLVDDDPDIANLYKLSLESDGFDVDMFSDPLLALSNYRAKAYDLLLLDIKMPKMNGFELYRELILIEDNIKVCFITAYEEYYKEFNKIFPNSKGENGCFIRKPVGLGELTRKVKTMLQNQ